MSFNYEAFVLSNSGGLMHIIEEYFKQTLATTPVGTDLRSLENAILVRTISVLFDAKVLSSDLSMEQYTALKRRVAKVLKN
jgi:hypothetical protein